MDEVVLLLIFACILIFMIIIFPQLTSDKKPIQTIPLTKMDHTTNTLSTKLSGQANSQLSKDQANSRIADPVSANITLDSYYTSAKEVPEDYPVKQIGDCPYTKAPSTDLPIANMPMCGINKGKETRLRAVTYP
jgi:hypothetical protein